MLVFATDRFKVVIHPSYVDCRRYSLGVIPDALPNKRAK
jgi:hypothetical protein